MNKSVLALVCSLMAYLGITLPAMAAIPYISASTGIGMLNDSRIGSIVARSYDTATPFTGAFGIENGPIRLEAEAGQRKNSVTSSPAAISMRTVMANGYLDLGLPFSQVKPFAVAGCGLATIDEHNGRVVAGDTVLAWQVGAGAGYALNPLVNIDLQYRYFEATTPQLAGYRYSMGGHNLLLGLRFDL
ncbi:MAG: outer membrane beta-barrel protein [Chlorobiaceae bacterium]